MAHPVPPNELPAFSHFARSSEKLKEEYLIIVLFSQGSVTKAAVDEALSNQRIATTLGVAPENVIPSNIP
jgi:hypothetical protein